MQNDTVKFIQDYVRDMANPATPDFQYLTENRLRRLVSKMDVDAVAILHEWINDQREIMAECYDLRAQRVDAILDVIGCAIFDFHG